MPYVHRSSQMWWCSHSLHCFLLHRSLTRISTAKTRLLTLPLLGQCLWSPVLDSGSLTVIIYDNACGCHPSYTCGGYPCFFFAAMDSTAARMLYGLEPSAMQKRC